jgi:phosphatidylinositol phospholipase C delta
MLKSSDDLLISATKKRLVRVYPGGHRQLSGNFSPVPALNAGIQLVALNHQTKDENLELLNCVFREAGDTGFALKPGILINGSQSVPGKRISINILEESIPKNHSVSLKVFEGLKKVTTTTLKKGKKTEL